ncbi:MULTISPECIES: winged helix-turn-helix domain-containing protein [Candidatus Fukatsuia]|nr:transcriptional regulator [Candidatus Fukatsuia symbiotica]
MNKRLYSVNNWLIDFCSGFMTHQGSGEKKRLGEYQLKLLDMLLQHAGEILSRDQLTHLVWEKRVIDNNSLPNAIHTLRVALGDDKKQQRVIQTIPKKGYLLDASYCVTVEENTATAIDENNDDKNNFDHNSNDVDKKYNVQNQDNVPDQNNDSQWQENISLPPLAKKMFLSTKIKIIFTLLLTVAVSSWITFVIEHNNRLAPNFFAEEQEPNVYRNIRLFQLRDDDPNTEDDDNLYHRLKDTLYLLDKEIGAKKMRMSIYYHLSLRWLDYTFLIENGCEKKQLNMTIYHWRLDNKNLNNLIYRETERKVNEMDPCHS